MKTTHKIVYQNGNTIIIRNDSEEFGTNYELYHESIPNALSFMTLQRALDYITSVERN